MVPKREKWVSTCDVIEEGKPNMMTETGLKVEPEFVDVSCDSSASVDVDWENGESPTVS